MFLISASGIRHYFPKVHTYFNNLCEFGSGTLNRFQFVVHFKSAITFSMVMVMVMNFWG